MDGAVLTFVLNNLSGLLEEKVSLIAGAEDEIRSLRDDLSMLTIFLGHINDQSDGNHLDLVQELVDQLQRVSWKAEDVVDEYLMEVVRDSETGMLMEFLSLRGHNLTGWRNLSRKSKLAKEAQHIKLTIDGILRNKYKYGILLHNVTPSDMTTLRHGENAVDRRRRNVEEEDVIGFEKQTCEVMEMLMLEGGVEVEGLRVVSIIGMGGLGKTTLARKIFKSEKISSHFCTKVWVVVSEHVEGKHVLKDILQYLNVSIEKDEDDYLKEKLKERLDERRYLIVLDDLWTPQQWQELKSYFPRDQKRGSRILLTSRIENVANVASTISTTYRPNPLGDADSWRLFCKKALKGEECPSNLEDIGKSIASKCKGLPLAIIVLGSLLAETEATPSFKYWSDILADTSWHPDADNDCSKILSLSYRNLPPHLRTCYLYVGVFPEDFEIAARELCLLWVAEGFVRGQGNKLEEDGAEQCLIKLANRHLIMISKRRSDGSIKFCRIHDLLRDLCVKEAEKCSLYKVHAVRANQNVEEGIRRLTLHKSYGKTRMLPSPCKGFRTLLDFTEDHSYNSRLASEDLSLLKVFHLDGLPVELDDTSLLTIINKQFLLRYLKLNRNSLGNQYVLEAGRFSMFMQTILRSSNLRVLNLNSEYMTNLPEEIWRLKHLRHVYVRWLGIMPRARRWMEDDSLPHLLQTRRWMEDESLPHLQTLSRIKYEEHTSELLCIQRFPNLRKLCLFVPIDNPLRPESLKSLDELLHFVVLKLVSYKKYEEDFATSLNVVAFPSTLTKIHMKDMALTSDHWRLLGELKNLQVLKLKTMRTHTSCEEGRFLEQPLVFEAEAFPQLIHLKLMTCHPSLILNDGALRTLQYLIIHPWTKPDLGWLELPDQLWLSTTLRQIKVISPSEDLKNNIQSLDDSKRRKVTISYSRRPYRQ